MWPVAAGWTVQGETTRGLVGMSPTWDKRGGNIEGGSCY